MARPTKKFLDYFPMYCREDERIEVLKAMYGISGYGVYITLLSKIYGEHGYYINWNDRACTLFANRVGMKTEEIDNIISILLDEGVFDKDMYVNHGILTSAEIQNNYLYAVSKRKNKELDKRYDLVSSPETGVSSPKTRVNSTESTQRKENKRKENKIKEECVKTAEPSTPAPRGEFNNVILTEDEYERLKEKFPDCDRTIERLSQYMASTGKEYNSHYAVLVKWAEEDKEKQITTKAASPQKESSFDIDEFLSLAIKRGKTLFDT